jgi:hypothetical protein
MNAATGRTRVHPVAGTALVLGVGIAALAGWLLLGRAQSPVETAVADGVSRDAGSNAGAACAMCGVVSSVRTLNARGDSTGRISYRVTVRMADGSYRTLAQPDPPSVGVGDRVRIAEGAVVRDP